MAPTTHHAMMDLIQGPAYKTRGRAEVNRATIVCAKSPLRVSFAGGGTDLPHYYEEHGGAVLCSTINRYSYVHLYPRTDRQISVRSVDLGSEVQYPVDEEPVFDGMLDLAKAALRRIGTDTGCELDVYTEALPGTGLGGSSAVTAAIIGAVSEYSGAVLTHYELAELNYTIERVDLGIAGGKQDQYATTFGGFNLIEFHKDRVSVMPLRIRREVLNDLEAHLLLCFTGKVRPGLGLIDKQVKYYHERRPGVADSMKRLHSLTFEITESLLRGDLGRFAELLDEEYQHKLVINPDVSTPHIDELIDLARRHGAKACKLLGAGGGGYLAIVAPLKRQHELRAQLERAGCVFTAFSFDRYGLQAWRSIGP